MLREISQTEKDKYCVVLPICGIKKKERWTLETQQKSRNWVLGLGGWQREGKIGSWVQTFSYKMKKSEDLIDNIVIMVDITVLYN